jgi:hypothetical protein
MQHIGIHATKPPTVARREEKLFQGENVGNRNNQTNHYEVQRIEIASGDMHTSCRTGSCNTIWTAHRRAMSSLHQGVLRAWRKVGAKKHCGDVLPTPRSGI